MKLVHLFQNSTSWQWFLRTIWFPIQGTSWNGPIERASGKGTGCRTSCQNCSKSKLIFADLIITNRVNIYRRMTVKKVKLLLCPPKVKKVQTLSVRRETWRTF